MAKKRWITNKSILGFHNSIVFVIVILTFIGSSLLFWQVNTSVLRKSIEAETNLVAALIEDDIIIEVPKEKSFQEEPETELAEVIKSVEEQLKETEDNDCKVWVINNKLEVLAESGKNNESADLSEEIAVSEETIDIGKLRKIRESESFTFWTGPRDFILLNQRCCVIRPIYNGDLFLVVKNTENTAIGIQRQQFALLMSLDLFLLLVMIILIVNNNARYEKAIIKIATTDETTGLANRKSFRSAFDEYMQAHADKASVFLLDIDFFKKINDNYGHSAGDSALRFLGGELSKLAARTGGIAGRWGGDEFIGILPLPEDRAREELEGLCQSVREHKSEEGFTMSVSIGVTSAGGERDIRKLTERADAALYEAKENGKDRVCAWSTCDAADQNLVQEVSQAHLVEDLVSAGNEMELADEQEHARTEAASTSGDIGSYAGINVSHEMSFKERFSKYVKDRFIMSTILGVRWMAPFIAGGGILIALAFLFDSMSVDLSTMTVTERAQLGSITPIAAMLKDLGGVSFNFMLPIFAGFMAYGIAGEAAFMAGFAGGFMTIDSNAGFVGAMFAGLVAGVITVELKLFTNKMPDWAKKAAAIIVYPVINLLIMKVITEFIVVPIAAAAGGMFTTFLENAVDQSHVAGGALAAMMMATDMGGIINKVAYNFGVASIAKGNTDIMAAVMIGGMVPPIGVFLSTVLFKDKFSAAEKDWGPGTLCMGLSFITEGVLPYVFTDVLRVIPSCMAGSAAAGLISVLLGCALPAPHGGIFVFPVITHALMYAAALAAGSLITAVILGLWKKVPNRDRSF